MNRKTSNTNALATPGAWAWSFVKVAAIIIATVLMGLVFIAMSMMVTGMTRGVLSWMEVNPTFEVGDPAWWWLFMAIPAVLFPMSFFNNDDPTFEGLIVLALFVSCGWAIGQPFGGASHSLVVGLVFAVVFGIPGLILGGRIKAKVKTPDDDDYDDDSDDNDDDND